MNPNPVIEAAALPSNYISLKDICNHLNKLTYLSNKYTSLANTSFSDRKLTPAADLETSLVRVEEKQKNSLLKLFALAEKQNLIMQSKLTSLEKSHDELLSTLSSMKCRVDERKSLVETKSSKVHFKF